MQRVVYSWLNNEDWLQVREKKSNGTYTHNHSAFFLKCRWGHESRPCLTFNTRPRPLQNNCACTMFPSHMGTALLYHPRHDRKHMAATEQSGNAICAGRRRHQPPTHRVLNCPSPVDRPDWVLSPPWIAIGQVQSPSLSDQQGKKSRIISCVPLNMKYRETMNMKYQDCQWDMAYVQRFKSLLMHNSFMRKVND